MIKLLKNLECFSPEYIGKVDILICGEKIYKLKPKIDIDENIIENIYDFDGCIAFPGLIDQHIHITGGGGEEGYNSHIPEIETKDITSAGVTTIVGLLGADGVTRSLKTLYAKAKALEQRGITAYIYSGSYNAPPVTFTGDITEDLVLIDKVIGVGEIAISDHRSSHVSVEKLMEIASAVHLGGLLSGKAGVFHLHVGDGKKGLKPLLEVVNNCDLPVEMFVPTHQNRNFKLFNQAVEYLRSGGNIDLTSGEKAGISVPEAMVKLIESGVDLSKVTVSSDANGSVPGGGISEIGSLFEDIRSCIIDKGINPEIAISIVTENVAKVLKLYPRKGTLKEGSDADIVITDNKFNEKMIFALGKLITDK